MDYLDRQDQEYRARVEKQQFVEKVKRDAALQERNIKEELPAGPLAERVQRLLDAAAACKESRDWHGACNLYQQVLRFKPDHHPSQLEVKSLAAIINAVAQQDKMEQRQRQFMERMQEPPGMRSLPGVGDKSPLQAPGRVVRSGPHAELTPEMYRQQLVAQMKANKAARAAAAQEEAALEGRVARVNAVELAVQRHASAAKMVQGYEDRRLEMVAKQQARAERWQEVKERLSKPVQCSDCLPLPARLASGTC